MPGAPTVLAQGVNQLITSWPGVRLPTRYRLVAAGAGASLPVIDTTKSTPGATIARSGVGVLQIGFPAGREFFNVNPQIYGVSPETANTRKTCQVDADTATTFANGGTGGTGQIQVYVSKDDDAANADLASGDRLDMTWEVDHG